MEAGGSSVLRSGVSSTVSDELVFFSADGVKGVGCCSAPQADIAHNSKIQKSVTPNFIHTPNFCVKCAAMLVEYDGRKNAAKIFQMAQVAK